MPEITRQQLFAEIDTLKRNLPTQGDLHESNSSATAWLGQLSAVISLINSADLTIELKTAKELMSIAPVVRFKQGYHRLEVLLNQAHYALQMETIGPTSVAVEHGSVFAYFDSLRKVIELATNDIFFIDPYLDADFVARYLPQVHASAAIRLLTSTSKLASLLPAVDLFSKENAGRPISVRLSNDLHDRLLIVDGSSCYHSGASFKDGGKAAATLLVQITDAAPAVLSTYESVWANAKPER